MMNRDGARQRSRAPARRLLNQTSLVRAMGEWAVSPTELVNADRTVMLRGAGNIAFGDPPPTAADEGTGIFIDATGMYGLEADVVNFYVSASDGKGYFGAGAAVLDASGIALGNSSLLITQTITAPTVTTYGQRIIQTITGTPSGAPNVVGFRVDSTQSASDSVGIQRGITIAMTVDALKTTSTLTGLHIAMANNGLTSNVYGIDIDSSFTGGSLLNAGIRISGPSAAATNFALYSAAAAQSVHAGNLRIGSTTAPTVALDVTGAIAVSAGLTGAVSAGSTIPAIVAPTTLGDSGTVTTSGTVELTLLTKTLTTATPDGQILVIAQTLVEIGTVPGDTFSFQLYVDGTVIADHPHLVLAGLFANVVIHGVAAIASANGKIVKLTVTRVGGTGTLTFTTSSGKRRRLSVIALPGAGTTA